MAGEPISGEAAGWSRRNVADVAIALIGFKLLFLAIGCLIFMILMVLAELRRGFPENLAEVGILTVFETGFLCLFLGLWLIADHRKITRRLFPTAQGVPLAGQRAALAFGIKVYAIYLAVTAATALVGMVSRSIVNDEAGWQIHWWALSTTSLAALVQIVFCLHFLRHPGWFVSFAFPEGEPDEDA
jgi:hypothetical protein